MILTPLPFLSSLLSVSARSLWIAGSLMAAATTSCASGPNYPEYDLAGDIPRHYQAPFIIDAPVIDGSLDDLAWRKASWTANFIDLGGSTISRPRFQSRAKMMWDRQYLYIGVWMVEPALKSESIGSLSSAGLMLLVTSNAESGSYQVVKAEPSGRIFTSTYNNSDNAPLPLMEGMRHGVALSGTLNQDDDADKGWWAEFALPWSSLTTAEEASIPLPGAEWRINLVRQEQCWSPYFGHDLRDPELWGKVQLQKL